MALLAIGGLGVGTGAGIRGLLALRDQMRDTTVDPFMHTSLVPTPIAVPIRPPQKRKPTMLASMLMRRQQPADGEPSMAKAATALLKAADPVQWIADLLPRDLPGETPPLPPRDPPPTRPGPLSGRFGIPAAVLAAGGGLYGGWTLMDWLAGKNRRDSLDTMTTDSETDYQKALAEQYRAAMRAKKAEDSLGIDDVFDAVNEHVKEASKGLIPSPDWYNSLWDGVSTPWSWFGAGPRGVDQFRGAVDTATIAAGLGTGYMAYNWVKSRNKQKLLEKAVQLRARQRQFTPSPFYAVSEPVHSSAAEGV